MSARVQRLEPDQASSNVKAASPIKRIMTKPKSLSPGGSSFLGTLAAAATRLSYANASCHSQQGPGHRPGEINPKVLKMAADYRGGRGAGWVHRRAADRAGKHGFKADDPANGNSSRDPLFLGARRDAQDHQHEEEREHELEHERLPGWPRRHR